MSKIPTRWQSMKPSRDLIGRTRPIFSRYRGEGEEMVTAIVVLKSE
jgi:hypothetical protein